MPKVKNVSHLKVLARLLKARDQLERGFLSPKVPSETFYSPVFCRDQKNDKQYEVPLSHKA